MIRVGQSQGFASESAALATIARDAQPLNPGDRLGAADARLEEISYYTRTCPEAPRPKRTRRTQSSLHSPVQIGAR